MTKENKFDGPLKKDIYEAAKATSEAAKAAYVAYEVANAANDAAANAAARAAAANAAAANAAAANAAAAKAAAYAADAYSTLYNAYAAYADAIAAETQKKIITGGK